MVEGRGRVSVLKPAELDSNPSLIITMEVCSPKLKPDKNRSELVARTREQ